MNSTSKNNLEFQDDIPTDGSSGGRLLHVYYDDWKMKSIRVLDSDKTTLLYSIDLKSRKPHMRIHSGSSNSQIGEINFHLLGTRIEGTLDSRDISLTPQGFTKKIYDYTSSTFPNTTLSWKPQSKWSNPLNLVLLDANAMPVARFMPVNWSKKKAGKLELLGSSAVTGPMMDEVVVTGLAVAQYKAQRMRTAGAASASSASVSVVV